MKDEGINPLPQLSLPIDFETRRLSAARIEFHPERPFSFVPLSLCPFVPLSLPPMPIAVRQLITQIHAAPTRLVLAASGGGSGAISAILTVPGASRTVLEAVVPYCEPAMLALLGGRPDQFCSQRTARAMAMAAFRRALAYETTDAPVAGVSCTSALVTDRPKSGPHRTHIGLQTREQTAFWSLELNKGARSRAEEEAVVDRLLLNAVADACQLEGRLDLDLLPGEIVATDRAIAPRPWQELLLGKVEAVRQQGAAPSRTDIPRAIFPGDFNPLHSGHQRMAELAQMLLGVPVEFEIAITNVDKPPLDYLEMRRRLGQFAPDRTVWFTRAARFVEKSLLFPGATFVVGIDTLRRLVAPRYYHDDPAACQAAIESIVSRRCRFLVFGRNLGTGFVGLGDIELPVPLLNLCREIPAVEFREDISSTALRRAGQE